VKFDWRHSELTVCIVHSDGLWRQSPSEVERRRRPRPPEWESPNEGAHQRCCIAHPAHGRVRREPKSDTIINHISCFITAGLQGIGVTS
jgi:hypothetical protein